jgi:acyl dehydratase
MNETTGSAAMSGWYFEDFKAGATIRTHGRTLTETDLVLAVALTGHSQPLFVDEEFAKKTTYGTRIAPGELTIGILAGLLTRTGILENQIGLLEIHCRFPHAMRAGDTVHAETEILETRLASAKDRGVVTFRDRLLNQKAEVVLDTRRVALFLARA